MSPLTGSTCFYPHRMPTCASDNQSRILPMDLQRFALRASIEVLTVKYSSALQIFTKKGYMRNAAPKPRRLRRRLKSMILQFDSIYRLVLLRKYGRPLPKRLGEGHSPNGVLKNESEWRDALDFGRRAHLPLHRAPEKNWDHLAAVAAINANCQKDARILDAGSELYSNVLPALFMLGFRHLYGMNLAFQDVAKRGPIRYLPGDITDTRFESSNFDAVTCLSVVEHGVPLEAFFEEMFRLLKPGGLLIVSTDYYPSKTDTGGISAYGVPVKIFSQEELEEMLAIANTAGFEMTAGLDLSCCERPVYWPEVDLRFTFVIVTLRKPSPRSTN